MQPTWSARIAVCGLHDKPNRKSSNDTCWKNRSASTNTDRKMPIVVKIATHDAAISRYSMARSTRLRARNSGSHATIRPAENENAENEDGRGGEIAAECAQLRVVLRGRGDLGARRAGDEVALDEVANVVVDEAELICRAAPASPPATNRARCCAATWARTPATARATPAPAARTKAPRSRRGNPAANESYAARRLSPPRRRAAGRGSSRAARDRRRRTTESMKPRSVFSR